MDRKLDEERRRQMEFYREQVDPEEEISRPRGYPRPVQFLLNFKIGTLLRLLENMGEDPASGTTLVICCGSGMESEILARRGMRVIALDLSMDAVERARERSRRYGGRYEVMVGNAEALPFAAESIDFVFVHDGLHHLPNPYQGVREMLRVSRRAVLIAEPADGLLTRIALRLGITSNYEEAGNYVFRLRPEEIAKAFDQFGFHSWKRKCSLVYYQPWTYRYYSLFRWQPSFLLFQAGFGLLNALVGRWGNSLRMVGRKSAREVGGTVRR